jgi:hypothetical protein
MRYHTFSVEFEHCTKTSDTRRQNWALITLWGDTELAIKSALEKSNPEFVDVVILSIEKRR